MIVVKLMGGLGNQMFQYAVGRHLAQINKVPLKMDLTFLKDRSVSAEIMTHRDYELGIFNIKEDFTADNEIKKYIKPKGVKKIIFKINQLINPKKIVREKHFHFDSSVLSAKKGSYLEGYFQTEKYFKGIEEIIRNDFGFKHSPVESISSYLKLIKESNSVSIHFRRGDFLRNQQVLSHHGVCSMEYYEKAVELINQKVSNPHYFIFSDDIVWVKENFRPKGDVTYVESKNIPAYEDLRMMSYCKHNIIANSSFSWWAAWLNANPDKIVIAPKKFLNEPSYNLQDIIPDSWIKI